MPSIMWVEKEMSLFSPGSRVVEPTTGWKGQHPSSIFTCTSSIWSGASPTLENSKA